MEARGRVNAYDCACGWTLATVTLEAGVTPMTVQCQQCGQGARSRFYQHTEGLTPTHAWWKPTPKQIRRMSPELAAHCRQGGLLLRSLGEEELPAVRELAEQVRAGEEAQYYRRPGSTVYAPGAVAHRPAPKPSLPKMAGHQEPTGRRLPKFLRSSRANAGKGGLNRYR